MRAKPNITVITGDKICDVNESLLEAVAKFAVQNQARDLAPIFVIVPDRFTLQAERILAQSGNTFLNLRVVTFSMLFNILYDLAEKTPAKILDKTTAVLLMWRAIRDVRENLLYFGNSVEMYSFAEKMFNTVNQLQSCRADFLKLESNAKTEVTKRKMHDISVIYARYAELCKDSIDGSGMLGWLIQNVASNPIVKSAHFYMTGFEYVSKQREEVFTQIAKTAKSFTLGARGNSEIHTSMIRETTIGAAAKKILVKTHSFKCNNVFEEAQTVANKICELIHNGVRYRDIALVVCDFEHTREIYASTLAAFSIPANIDVGHSLMDTHIAKNLRDTLLGAPWVVSKQSLSGTKSVAKFCATAKKLLPEQSGESNDTTAQVYEKIHEVIDTVTESLGTQVLPAAEFCNMLCTLFTAVKISDVPANLDRVTVADINEFVPTKTPYVFISGASAESFPPSVPDTDIITEQDIGDMKIVIEPTARTQGLRLLRHARNVVDSGVVAVFKSYSATNVLGETCKHSPLFNSETVLDVHDVFSPVYAETQVLSAIGTGAVHKTKEAGTYFASLKKAANIKSQKLPDFGPVTKDVDETLFVENKISVTAAENFLKCPHYYFINNVLGCLEKRPVNAVEPMVTGTILHDFCERYIKDGGDPNKIITDLLKNHNLPKFSIGVIKKLACDIAEFMDKEKEGDNFVPTHFEYPIEGQIDGIKIRGKIDRIDTSGKDCVVVDYKSGDAGSVRLQVPLYMSLLKDHGFNPVGGYYLNLRQLQKTKVAPESGEEAQKKLGDAVARIKSGDVRTIPIHGDVCRYCPVRGMCGGRI
ncbi:MAG: PD-(D/E)XK nuclease family protein [Firmicutes bacterium]|nr:PD-(D/E)XK nuclease family protein [Bacillota bacterium]